MAGEGSLIPDFGGPVGLFVSGINLAKKYSGGKSDNEKLLSSWKWNSAPELQKYLDDRDYRGKQTEANAKWELRVATRIGELKRAKPPPPIARPPPLKPPVIVMPQPCKTDAECEGLKKPPDVYYPMRIFGPGGTKSVIESKQMRRAPDWQKAYLPTERDISDRARFDIVLGSPLPKPKPPRRPRRAPKRTAPPKRPPPRVPRKPRVPPFEPKPPGPVPPTPDRQPWKLPDWVWKFNLWSEVLRRGDKTLNDEIDKLLKRKFERKGPQGPRRKPPSTPKVPPAQRPTIPQENPARELDRKTNAPPKIDAPVKSKPSVSTPRQNPRIESPPMRMPNMPPMALPIPQVNPLPFFGPAIGAGLALRPRPRMSERLLQPNKPPIGQIEAIAREASAQPQTEECREVVRKVCKPTGKKQKKKEKKTCVTDKQAKKLGILKRLKRLTAVKRKGLRLASK